MTSGRAALIKNQVEEPDYGMYSYLLLGAPPNERNRDRYLSVLSAFVTGLPDVKDLEDAGFERAKLNITYMLLEQKPPAELLKPGGGAPDRIAEWALSHYDYARARSMLSSLPGGNGDGPYLISTLQPFIGRQGYRAGYLYQDLSVEPRCIKFWAGEFLDRANRATSRGPASFEPLAHKLQEVLASPGSTCLKAEASDRIRWSGPG
jgi:hypothetical protein